MPSQFPIESMPLLVRDFAKYKLSIQNCSEKTVDEYLCDLRLFFKYIYASRNRIDLESEFFDKILLSGLDNDFVLNISPEEIYDFFMYLSRGRGNGASSRARKLSAIKSFYKYACQKRRLSDNNPTVDIEGPKLKQSLPKFLSVEESLLLLNAIESDTESRFKERDYAIITLFLNCGMRLSELCGIKLSDIDRELRSLRVIGKGKKERIIYLHDACRQALGRYLEIRRSEKYKGIGTNALFISKQ